MQQRETSLACSNGSEYIVGSIEPALKRRTDIFDYIERFHNPKMQATGNASAVCFRLNQTVRGNGVKPKCKSSQFYIQCVIAKRP